MRNDMAKVIGERPRRGVGYYRTLPNEYRVAKRFNLTDELDVDDRFCSTKLPMRSHSFGWDGKEQNANLTPLRRFLYKQVGRRWDEVYSEVCSTVNSNSIVKQSHRARCAVRDFVKDNVCLKSYYKDGKLWAAGKYGPSPITHYDLYVDDQGILRDTREPNLVKKLSYRERVAAREREWKRVINGVTYKKENGNQWFRIVQTERTYMETVYHGHGIAPSKRLKTVIDERKWTVNHNDLRDLKLYE